MTHCGRLFVVAGMAAVGVAAPGQPVGADGIPFDVASLFFELNDTDGDLGIHADIDGEPWRRLEIKDPGKRGMLHVRVQGRLRRQGLTELSFESAEPNFDELPAEEFFRRFPEGTYEISGATLEGEELESAAELTHLLPAPPVASVNGEAAAEDCDAELPVVDQPIVISWDQVALSHPDLGRTNEPIEVVSYEVVIEREQPTSLELTAIVDPDTTSFAVPSGLLNAGEEIKYGVLVQEASGNRTAVESCFVVAE